MKLHDLITCKGYFTLARTVRGRTVRELEQLLGFRARTLEAGAFIGVLTNLPEKHEFELAGYSQVADHKQGAISGLDTDKLKNTLCKNYWKTFGDYQPVKIFPVSPGYTGVPDTDFPPGAGVPQWKLTSIVNVHIVAFISGDQRAFW